MTAYADDLPFTDLPTAEELEALETVVWLETQAEFTPCCEICGEELVGGDETMPDYCPACEADEAAMGFSLAV